MKILGVLGVLALLFSAIAITLPDSAEAARMGGGRSFGGSPSMSRPAPSRSVQPPAQTRRAAPGAAAAPASGGMFGGMGGVLGGLFAGTLLGSLFFGHGPAGAAGEAGAQAAGGAGFGFIDFILIALLAYFAWRLYSRFRNQSSAGAGAGYQTQGARTMSRSDAPGSSWGSLSGQTPSSADPSVDVPPDFDTEDFLKGARMAYTRMQSSWDKRDLADIAQFATPAVMRELEAQAAQDPAPSRTEIMTVKTSLLGVEDEGDTRRAQVYFDVLMRENPSDPAPENVREVWHFIRAGRNGSWKLDGIQQVE